MKKVLVVLAAVAITLFAPMAVVYAEEEVGNDCVESSIISNKEENGKKYYCDTEGSGIYKILNIVLTILTMGVGILGTLGVIIAGTQYMTAGGNEAQMAKAKKRIGEVVLGLVVYGVMYVVLQWLIPGGIF